MTIKFTTPFEECDCTLNVEKYYNGNLAIKAYSEDGPFATLTTNFDKKLKPNVAFLDENNCPFALEPLCEAGIIKASYIEDIDEYEPDIVDVKFSGMCMYCAYEFDLDKLKEYAI